MCGCLSVLVCVCNALIVKYFASCASRLKPPPIKIPTYARLPQKDHLKRHTYLFIFIPIGRPSPLASSAANQEEVHRQDGEPVTDTERRGGGGDEGGGRI